jgi:hypothetical protein
LATLFENQKSSCHFDNLPNELHSYQSDFIDLSCFHQQLDLFISQVNLFKNENFADSKTFSNQFTNNFVNLWHRR